MGGLKLRLSQIALFVYLIALSFILKKFLLLPFAAAIAAVILEPYIKDELKGLIYIIAALLPYPTFLYLFLFYLPLCVYGLLFNDGIFTKKYIFGYTIALFSAAVVYVIGVLLGNVSTLLIISAYYLPAAIIIIRLILRKEGQKFISSFRIGQKELFVIIVSIGFLFCMGGFVINNENMYNSNGTYMYTKFFTVFDYIRDFGKIPQYDPRIGQGEQLFLSDTPTFYSNLAFVASILKIDPILFFNSITLFIIWLSMLGAWLFLHSLLGNRDDYMHYAISLIGGMAIVYSFTYFELFESFKQSSSYPFDFLALSLIFSFSWHSRELLAIALSLMASFLTHPTKASGVILIAAFSFIFIVIKGGPREKIRRGWDYFAGNKTLTVLVLLALALIPVFYLFPSVYYANYAREAHFPQLSEINPIGYIKQFFVDRNISPLSYSYPEPQRLDQKKYGFFFSFFGVLCALLIMINIKNKNLSNARILILAFILHFLVSSIIAFVPPFGQAEYGYRTATPFLLAVLVASICVLILNIRRKTLLAAALLIFLGGFLHSAYYSSQNLRNIHKESVISGKTFQDEVSLIKQIPIDGRFMSLGWYSNAIDMAFSVQTDRYFSRYGYLQWDFSDNIYEKITTMNSFGVTETIEPMTSNEFSNYLRLSGYKYAFLNICHPVGNLALQKLYPENAYPIYQNPNYQCIVILGINNSNYAEKVKIIESVNESDYLLPEGYWHITFNRNKKIHNFDLGPYGNAISDSPAKPIALQFRRTSFENAEIYGNFRQGDWVVFKEEYFPRWKASMNGKEVPLIATNNRMMLINADDGAKIELSYDLEKDEKTATFISLPAILLVFILLILAV